MSSPPAPSPDAQTARPAAARGRRTAGWHGGWALAMAALFGAALLAGDRAGLAAGAPLALAAVPGLVGAFGGERARAVLLTLWTLAAAAAAGLSGGPGGPLGALLLAPGAAAAVLGFGVGRGALLIAGAASLALLGGGGEAFAAGALRNVLGLGALAAVAGAGAASAARRSGGAVPEVSRAPAPSVDPARLEAAERARAEAEADRDHALETAAARTRFLAHMSHELRTPLNAVMGFSDIMRTRLFGPLPDRYGEYAELIHESGRHLLDVINDVLDLAKIDAGRYELRREVFDAREATAAALRLVRVQADEAGVRLRGLPPPGPLEVDADPRALKQMVLNLLANALKFTPRGGEATVTVGAVEGELEIVVSDTGVGVAPEDVARLGRPFEQTEAGRRAGGGTGLGLSLVRAFAGLHGGAVTIESRLGSGTAVTVRLPVLVRADVPVASARA